MPSLEDRWNQLAAKHKSLVVGGAIMVAALVVPPWEAVAVSRQRGTELEAVGPEFRFLFDPPEVRSFRGTRFDSYLYRVRIDSGTLFIELLIIGVATGAAFVLTRDQ